MIYYIEFKIDSDKELTEQQIRMMLEDGMNTDTEDVVDVVLRQIEEE